MSDYTTITKGDDNVAFILENDYYGWLHRGVYKDSVVDKEDGTASSCYSTWATSFVDAISFMKEDYDGLKRISEDCPKSKFNLFMIDGTWNNKLDRPKEVKVFTITAKNYIKLFKI